MDKFDYLEAQQTAKGLIDTFGAAGTFVTPAVNGGIDPATGSAVGSSAVNKLGVVTPVLKYNAREVDGTSILTGDGYVFFYGSALPAVDDKITINSQSWRAVEINGLASVDGISVYNQIQLRK